MENAQTKWEFLRCEVRKFTIDYSNTIAKKGKQQRINLELKLKILIVTQNLEETENCTIIAKLISRLFLVILPIA